MRIFEIWTGVKPNGDNEVRLIDVEGIGNNDDMDEYPPEAYFMHGTMDIHQLPMGEITITGSGEDLLATCYVEE